MIRDFQNIPQDFRRVKFYKRAAPFILLCALMISSIPKSWAYQVKISKLYTTKFEPHPNYLAMNLQEKPAAELRKEVEAKEKIELKNRGEAHVTVITPPEFEILKSALSMEDINQIAKIEGLQKADLQIVCLGKGQAPEKGQTYFLVLKSKKLLRIRNEIEKAFKSKGGQGTFESSHFYPHVTLGFTERDLHEADGVIKDERSCLSDVSTR